ncbi:MAG: response regulator transcription factor [Cyanobacteriota bacterium]|nr:response regulator transcription factor [Cyanobacteriota bacterium]MDY6359312.1 response regulator transcription factor [Cyanobacteriota bacterium]MDY6364957.1 response regulator transcription factor [Cyanobacteriota bacterium]MDY6382893.1 response regulator transcription factor [Cyanobacteriota bacterium]
MSNNITDAKILIVEDEPQINRLVELVLQSAGYYKIRKAYDGREALNLIKIEKPDLILLDIMIPEIDGFELCKMIKNDNNLKSVQIIMLTAKKMEEDILKGFESGAIDYISKPFSNRILLARIKAHLLNSTINTQKSYKNITLDNLRKSVTLDGKLIKLTKFEYIILETFITNVGIVFSRSQLLSYLRGDDGFNVSERAMDVQIVNLRKKLGDFGSNIETVRGLGYKLKECNE